MPSQEKKQRQVATEVYRRADHVTSTPMGGRFRPNGGAAVYRYSPGEPVPQWLIASIKDQALPTCWRRSVEVHVYVGASPHFPGRDFVEIYPLLETIRQEVADYGIMRYLADLPLEGYAVILPGTLRFFREPCPWI